MPRTCCDTAIDVAAPKLDLATDVFNCVLMLRHDVCIDV